MEVAGELDARPDGVSSVFLGGDLDLGDGDAVVRRWIRDAPGERREERQRPEAGKIAIPVEWCTAVPVAVRRHD